MALKVKAVEKLLKFSNDPNDKGARPVHRAESGKGDQGSCTAQRRDGRRNEGLLGRSWTGNQGVGH